MWAKHSCNIPLSSVKSQSSRVPFLSIIPVEKRPEKSKKNTKDPKDMKKASKWIGEIKWKRWKVPKNPTRTTSLTIDCEGQEPHPLTEASWHLTNQSTAIHRQSTNTRIVRQGKTSKQFLSSSLYKMSCECVRSSQTIRVNYVLKTYLINNITWGVSSWQMIQFDILFGWGGICSMSKKNTPPRMMFLLKFNSFSS